jgi:uncharacterized membrane protein
MGKERLLAFSDGVLAIIITIMVLELRPPEGDTLAALKPLLPKLLSYILSFIYVGIYWNNHHHLFHVVKQVNGNILWKNLHLLFWLSLIPFVTAWMGEHHFSTDTVILYGIVLFMCAVAYSLLLRGLLKLHGHDSLLSKSIGNDFKGNISVAIYIAGILLSLINGWLGIAMYAAVAIMWFIPDRRIENKKILKDNGED